MPKQAVSPQLPHHLQAQKTIRRDYSRRDFVAPRPGMPASEAGFEQPVEVVPVLEEQVERPIRVSANIAGYPIHSMLVPIAIGNFVFSFASDIVFLITGHPQPWNTLAFYTLVAGLLTALVAAVPGAVDLSSLPAGRIRKIGLIHARINVIAVTIIAVNAYLRYGRPEDLGWPILLSTITVMMLSVSGWLGAKLVAQAGVGLDPTGAEVAEDELARNRLDQRLFPKR